MRILHMDSDIPSVFFPIGKLSDGGTCEFATSQCMELCPSGGEDEINEHERFAYNFFKTHTDAEILKKMLEDYEFLLREKYNAHMIQWFTWGDCPSKLTQTVVSTVMSIENKGIPQYGFTRNEELWKAVHSNDILNIGLSIDELYKAKKVSIESGKMIAHPDFVSGYAEMIFNGEIVSRCNGWWCKTSTETRNSDCTRCLINGEGCYFH